MIFRYDGSLEGLLCCVFESFRSRRLPLDIWEAQEPRLSLVPEFTVPSRREEAARVWRRLRQLSPDAAAWTETGFLSGEEDKAAALHAFLCMVFRQGRGTTGLLGDPVVARAFQLQRRSITKPIASSSSSGSRTAGACWPARSSPRPLSCP